MGSKCWVHPKRIASEYWDRSSYPSTLFLRVYDMRTGTKLYEVATATQRPEYVWLLWPEQWLGTTLNASHIPRTLHSLIDGSVVPHTNVIDCTVLHVVPSLPLSGMSRKHVKTMFLNKNVTPPLLFDVAPAHLHSTADSKVTLVSVGAWNHPASRCLRHVELPRGVIAHGVHSDAVFFAQLPAGPHDSEETCFITFAIKPRERLMGTLTCLIEVYLLTTSRIDLAALHAAIRAINIEGLLWGEAKVVPVKDTEHHLYMIATPQMGGLMSIDAIMDHIRALTNLVESVTIASNAVLSVIYLSDLNCVHVMCTLPCGVKPDKSLFVESVEPFLHGPALYMEDALHFVRRPSVPASLSILHGQSQGLYK